MPEDRRASRLFVRDELKRVLLFEMHDRHDAARPTWWVTPGGGLEGTESHAEAAQREALEELGLVVDQLGPVVLERTVAFHFERRDFRQCEQYFAVDVPSSFVPVFTGWTELEQQVTRGWRWWTVDELETTKEIIYPEGLTEILAELE